MLKDHYPHNHPHVYRVISGNQTAKYQIHVIASQQQQTEGLSKLMDIMASCIEPVTVEEDNKQ